MAETRGETPAGLQHEMIHRLLLRIDTLQHSYPDVNINWKVFALIVPPVEIGPT